MFSALSIAALVARGRQLLSGPGALAIAATAIAVLFVGSIALGLVWLRGDAARDAAAKAVAVCEADKLKTELAAERQRTAALVAAQAAREATIQHLTEQRRLDEAILTTLEGERANAIEEARKWEEAAGRRDTAVFRADDPWLRESGAAARGAAGAPGR